MYTSFTDWNNGLAHHGIRNQKWGVRRFQNEDGSYTSEGRQRYGIGEAKKALFLQRKSEKLMKKSNKALDKQKTEKAQKLKEKSIKYAKFAKMYMNRANLRRKGSSPANRPLYDAAANVSGGSILIYSMLKKYADQLSGSSKNKKKK